MPIDQASDCCRQHWPKRKRSCEFSPRGPSAGAASSRPTAGSLSRKRAQSNTVASTTPLGANRSGLTGSFPDGRRFGRVPEVVFTADGAKAERMITFIRQAVRHYAYPNIGDYCAWPGPNSNTFVAAIIAAVPGMPATLPPTALGKDFPFDRRWLGWTPSRTGVRINLGGYLGLSMGWVEGVEINLLSAVAGIDLRRPAVKLPGLGRLGVALLPRQAD
jgi:hypothetical protein